MTTFDVHEFLGAFLGEATEHLELATHLLLDVETALASGRHDRRAVRETYRAFHTIKGLAGMVGIDPIVDLAHAMEAILQAAEEAGGQLDSVRVDLLLSGVRAIESRLKAIAEQKPVAPAPRGLLDALRDAELAQPSIEALELDIEIGDSLESKLQLADRESLADARRRRRQGFRVDFTPSAEKNERGLNITSVRERVGAIAEIVRVLPLSRPEGVGTPVGLAFALIVISDGGPEAIAAAVEVEPDQVRALWSPATGPLPPPSAPEEEPISPGSATFVRVEVKRLDDALERLSSVVVDRFRLVRAVAELRERGLDVRRLEEIVASGGRQLRDLRSAIMRARMVPVAELLDRVPLIVRSLSRATGKAARLQIDAGRLEVDKAVAERIFPAIVHLVRNAIDHGIEGREERAAAGKPETGLIKINCREIGSSRLELSIEDDGRGIDRTALVAESGRPVPESDAALLDLLCTPGLTTTVRPSHTSGRGLGMDIVARIVMGQLGGTLGVSSVLGRGTTFALAIPLSITIVDAFTLTCSGRTFAVPVGSIEEILEIDPSRSVSVGDSTDTRLVERRGEAVPLIDLGLALALGEARERRKALLVRRNDQVCAFAVDRMIARQEVVIRPLEDLLVRVPGVSGATDLGDGRPTLVLDLIALSGDLHKRRELAS